MSNEWRNEDYEDWKEFIFRGSFGHTSNGCTYEVSIESLYQKFKERLIEELRVTGQTGTDEDIYGFVESSD